MALIVFNFFPYWTAIENNSVGSYALYSYALTHQQSGELTLNTDLYVSVASLTGIAVVIALIEIFSFKNRIKQMKLGVLNSMVMTLTLLIMTYFVWDIQNAIKGKIGIGLFILAMAIIFNILARRFIQKDEQLVRSVDRLR